MEYMQIVYDTSSLTAAIIFGTFMYNSEDFHVRSGEGSFDVILLHVRGGCQITRAQECHVTGLM
jgi:hypothetical protein